VPIKTEIINLLPGPEIDTFTTLLISVRAVNQSDEAIVLDHIKTKIFFELWSENDELLLVIDEICRQNWLFNKRSRRIPAPVTIMPGAQEIFEFDFANYYYPLAAGKYKLILCHISGEGDKNRGNVVEITVTPRQVEQAVEWYENPVFGTHSLLLRALSNPGEYNTFLRWLGLNRPLASYINKKLRAVPSECAAFPSIPAFFDVEEFAPGFEKVIIFQSIQKVMIFKFENGDPVGSSMTVQLPEGLKILPFSFRTLKEIFIFSLGQGGSAAFLHGHVINQDSGSVTQFLNNILSVNPSDRLAIAGGPDLIHVVTAGKNLVHSMFSYNGDLVTKNSIGTYDGYPVNLVIDLVADFIRASYIDSQTQKNLTVIELPFPTLDQPKVTARKENFHLKLEEPETIIEIDTLFDQKARCHILFTTDKGKLFYDNTERNLQHLATGEIKYWPRLLKGDMEYAQPYVGFFLKSRGYRFYSTEGKEPWNGIINMQV